MKPLLWVCLGGAVGSGSRYLMTLLAHRVLGAGFPYGTLTVNLAGSFLLGLLLTAWPAQPDSPSNLRLALGTGVLGGFTTYSTFNYETLRLFETGSSRVAAGYLAATLAGCLVAGLGGIVLGRALRG